MPETPNSIPPNDSSQKGAMEEEAKPIAVVIKTMPDTPSKSLWHDSTRLLSLAAFILSLVTGAYAAYSTWKAQRDATVESVGKLIAEYYSNAEKIKLLKNDAYDISYFNLLRTQQRAEIVQAVQKALTVRTYVTTAIWMSLAQINYEEQNCPAAETAWLSAINNTEDISEYLFALRGIAANEWCLNRLPDAEKRLGEALNAAESEEVTANHTIKNYLRHAQRMLDISSTHLQWLTLYPSDKCEIMKPHYDAAVAAFADATSGITLPDKTAGDQAGGNIVLSTRFYIDQFKEARSKCL